MSSTRGQSMNYLSAPPPLPKSSGSLGNCKLNSPFSSINVYTNSAYDYVESGSGSIGSGNDYEELPTVTNEAKAISVPRKKTNNLYESAQSYRKRQITECSDDSIVSTMSTEIIQVKRDSCLNKLILLLILAVSVAALVLVILVISNIIGPKCSCSKGNAMTSGNQPTRVTRTAKMSSVQSLQDMIARLENRLSEMKVKMEIRERTVDIQIKILNDSVFAQGRRINETGNKVAAVDGVWMNMTNTHKAFESKLDSEFRLINKSMKTLSDSDSDLAASINELKVNQTITDRMRKRLSMNVSQIELHVQELTGSSNNVKRKVENLERGYAHMNASILALETKAVTQNASHSNLWYLYDNLAGSLSTVNSTLYSKIVGAPLRMSPGFKGCHHRRMNGTGGTATKGRKVDLLNAYSSAHYKTPVSKQAVGITCSTDYARNIKLVAPRDGFYECQCKGVSPVFESNAPPTMHCYLHVWECPA